MVLTLALAACGYFGGHARAPAAAQAHRHGPPAPDPAAMALAGMIDAVGPGTGRAPFTLKFVVRSRPEVGKLDEIDFALIPRKDINSLRIVFGGRDGLDVVSGGHSRAFSKPAPGVPLFGAIEVRPARAGIFTVTAAVGVETPSQSVVWPFSIPLIAAKGLPQRAGVSAHVPTPSAVAAVSP